MFANDLYTRTHKLWEVSRNETGVHWPTTLWAQWCYSLLVSPKKQPIKASYGLPPRKLFAIKLQLATLLGKNIDTHII